MGKVAKWRKFTEEEFAELVRQSTSFQELAGKLGYVKTGGGSAQILKDVVKERNLDTSHFLGQKCQKNNFDYDRFQYGKPMKSYTMRKALIYKRGQRCEDCGLTEWLDKQITLEVHHIDGNHINNVETNLQLLCPNCHSQTHNYKIKNSAIFNKKQVPDDVLIDALKKSSSIKQGLLLAGLTQSGKNYARAYNLIDQYNIEHLKK